MCNLSQGVEEKGIAKGIKLEREAGTLRAIKNLMDSVGWTIEQAMNALKVSGSDREKYVAMLKEK